MVDKEPSRVQVIELYEETFRAAILRAFKDEIQRQYTVTGYAAMPNGKVVIRLERDIFPKEPQS